MGFGNAIGSWIFVKNGRKIERKKFDTNSTCGDSIQFDPEYGKDPPLGRVYCLAQEDYVVAPNETFLLPVYMDWTDVEPVKDKIQQMELVPDRFVANAGNRLSMLESLQELEQDGFIFSNVTEHIISIPKHTMLATVLPQKVEKTHVVLDPGVKMAYMLQDQTGTVSDKEICE